MAKTLPFAALADLAKPRLLTTDALRSASDELRRALMRHLDDVQVIMLIDPESILTVAAVSGHIRKIILPPDEEPCAPSTPQTEASQELPHDPPYRSAR